MKKLKRVCEFEEQDECIKILKMRQLIYAICYVLSIVFAIILPIKDGNGFYIFFIGTAIFSTCLYAVNQALSFAKNYFEELDRDGPSDERWVKTFIDSQSGLKTLFFFSFGMDIRFSYFKSDFKIFCKTIKHNSRN